jgi:hypothetical protein
MRAERCIVEKKTQVLSSHTQNCSGVVVASEHSHCCTSLVIYRCMDGEEERLTGFC